MQKHRIPTLVQLAARCASHEDAEKHKVLAKSLGRYVAGTALMSLEFAFLIAYRLGERPQEVYVAVHNKYELRKLEELQQKNAGDIIVPRVQSLLPTVGTSVKEEPTPPPSPPEANIMLNGHESILPITVNGIRYEAYRSGDEWGVLLTIPHGRRVTIASMSAVPAVS